MKHYPWENEWETIKEWGDAVSPDTIEKSYALAFTYEENYYVIANIKKTRNVNTLYVGNCVATNDSRCVVQDIHIERDNYIMMFVYPLPDDKAFMVKKRQLNNKINKKNTTNKTCVYCGGQTVSMIGTLRVCPKCEK